MQKKVYWNNKRFTLRQWSLQLCLGDKSIEVEHSGSFFDSNSCGIQPWESVFVFDNNFPGTRSQESSVVGWKKNPLEFLLLSPKWLWPHVRVGPVVTWHLVNLLPRLIGSPINYFTVSHYLRAISYHLFIQFCPIRQFKFWDKSKLEDLSCQSSYLHCTFFT